MITPILGHHPAALVAWIIAWCVINIALVGVFLALSNDGFGHSGFMFTRQFLITIWLVGTVYGFASGLCWMSTVFKSSLHRYAARLLVLVGLSAVLNLVATDSWFRNLSSIGGVLVCQCTLFFLFQVPSWQREILESPLPRRQYRIIDVVVGTTAIAFLLAIVLRYPTPIYPLAYWLIMIAVWLTCPLIGASVFVASLSRGRTTTVWGVVAVCLSVASAFGMSWAQASTSDSMLAMFEFVPIYGIFFLFYLITLAGFGLAARSQAIDPYRRGQSVV